MPEMIPQERDRQRRERCFSLYRGYRRWANIETEGERERREQNQMDLKGEREKETKSESNFGDEKEVSSK